MSLLSAFVVDLASHKRTEYDIIEGPISTSFRKLSTIAHLTESPAMKHIYTETLKFAEPALMLIDDLYLPAISCTW
jgi:hypothetical protein